MTPRDSVVLVAFRGNRTVGGLRLDLPPDFASENDLDHFSRVAFGMICKIPQVDAVVPVIYTPALFGDRGRIPHEVVAFAVIRYAEVLGFLVREALCVAADGWGSYFGDDHPSDGYPLDRIEHSSVHDTVRASPAYRELVDTDAAATLPCVPLFTAERVASRLLRFMELVNDASIGENQEVRDAAVAIMVKEFGLKNYLPVVHVFPLGLRMVSFAEAVIERVDERDTETDALFLAWLASLPRVRIVLLATIAWGAAAGETAFANLMGDDPGDLAFTDPPPRPDVPRLEAAIEVFRAAAGLLPLSSRPPILSMLAWSHWALGHGSIAGRWIDMSRDIEPLDDFTLQLDVWLASGRLPEWAFAVPLDISHGNRGGIRGRSGSQGANTIG